MAGLELIGLEKEREREMERICFRKYYVTCILR